MIPPIVACIYSKLAIDELYFSWLVKDCRAVLRLLTSNIILVGIVDSVIGYESNYNNGNLLAHKYIFDKLWTNNV